MVYLVIPYQFRFVQLNHWSLTSSEGLKRFVKKSMHFRITFRALNTNFCFDQDLWHDNSVCSHLKYLEIICIHLMLQNFNGITNQFGSEWENRNAAPDGLLFGNYNFIQSSSQSYPILFRRCCWAIVNCLL